MGDTSLTNTTLSFENTATESSSGANRLERKLNDAIIQRQAHLEYIKTTDISNLLLSENNVDIDSAHSGIYKFKPVLSKSFVLHVLENCYAVILPSIVSPNVDIYIHNRTLYDIAIVNPTAGQIDDSNIFTKYGPKILLPLGHSYRFVSSLRNTTSLPKWELSDIINYSAM